MGGREPQYQDLARGGHSHREDAWPWRDRPVLLLAGVLAVLFAIHVSALLIEPILWVDYVVADIRSPAVRDF